MKNQSKILMTFVLGFALTAALPMSISFAGNPCNPCDGKDKEMGNPCNPCNPCDGKKSDKKETTKNPCNPCDGKEMKNPCNPCNPCGGGAQLNPQLIRQPKGTNVASSVKLIKEGERLFNDNKLGKSGLSCATCHVQVDGGPYGAMMSTFEKPYPHYVKMAQDKAGLKEVNAAEMVQFCMMVPMKADPLPWGSKDLAALTSYVLDVQKGFKKSKVSKGMNPCNPCNPCSH